NQGKDTITTRLEEKQVGPRRYLRVNQIGGVWITDSEELLQPLNATRLFISRVSCDVAGTDYGHVSTARNDQSVVKESLDFIADWRVHTGCSDCFLFFQKGKAASANCTGHLLFSSMDGEILLWWVCL